MAEQVQLLIRPDGGVSMHVASILYDLHEDYRYFAGEARKIGSTGDSLTYKRFARAAIISFFNYFDGVINRWVATLSPQTDLDQTGIGDRLRIIRDKINNDRGRRIGSLDLSATRMLRNKICHLKLGDSDLEITRELLEGHFLQDVKHLENWLAVVSHRLNLECHPDVDLMTRQFFKALESMRP